MTIFTLQELPFEYSALEPHIDEETLHIHHDKHHQAYCDKFNTALESAGIEEENILEIFKKISNYPLAVRNNGGGFWNHQFYWESMGPEKEEPQGELLEEIKKHFGSYDSFKTQFQASAATLFGSGWTWLGVKENGDLIIHNTQNQDNTYMDIIKEKYTPLLVIDVWEHAYYLKYQNKRPEYIENFFKVINWKEVERRFSNL